MVAQPPVGRAPGTIVVGVDGSEASAAALRWALEEARRRGTTLRLVHAWHRPLEAAPMAAPMWLDGEVFESLRTAAAELLDRMVAEAGDAATGVELERIVVEAGAARALLAAADGADLLVVGSRGHGGFLGLLLGSVSQQCAHHAPCPVVIVPAPAQAAA